MSHVHGQADILDVRSAGVKIKPSVLDELPDVHKSFGSQVHVQVYRAWLPLSAGPPLYPLTKVSFPKGVAWIPFFPGETIRCHPFLNELPNCPQVLDLCVVLCTVGRKGLVLGKALASNPRGTHRRVSVTAIINAFTTHVVQDETSGAFSREPARGGATIPTMSMVSIRLGS